MENKLYHIFYVSEYKGGELHSWVNLPIEEVAAHITGDIDWEELFECFADDEKFANMPDEEFFSLSCTQLLDMIDDKNLEDIAYNKAYPGNIYAFDTRSDYEIYTQNEKGELKEINIVKEPGFIEAFRKALREDAEWTDKYREKHKNEE
jgi:hypothetical protein